MYKQITAADRGRIDALLHQDYTLTMIASIIGVHKSTISREINRRSTPNGYFAEIAQIDRDVKRNNSKPIPILSNSYKRNHVINRLLLGDSPEQIAGRSKLCCSETIYRFIYSDSYCVENKLYQCLRRAKRRRTKIYVRRSHTSKIPNKISIHQRPSIKEQFGHWEGDTVHYTNKQAIATFNELKTGYLVFRKLERRTAELTKVAMIEVLAKHKALTLTVDNGLEFTRHEQVTTETNTNIYFADPYSSYQRGSNENSNGLLRRYLPKRSSIEGLTQDELDSIADELNNRPRKRLNYQTPAEAYQHELLNLNVAVGIRM